MRFFASMSIGLVVVVGSGITAVHAGGDKKEDRQIAAGRQVFNRTCVACHGKEGAGTPMARPLNQRGGTYGDTPDQIAGVVRDGVKGTQMRGFKGTLKEQQIKSVAAYVASLRK